MVLEASGLGHRGDLLTPGANAGAHLPQSATQPEFGEALGLEQLELLTNRRFVNVG